MTNSRVLLVEDDPTLSFAIKHFLEKQNYDVTLCTHGDLAWKDFMKSKYDICLLDIMLAGRMDGLELAKQIRSKNSRIPILILSSKVSEQERIAGLEIGADSYITKPCNFDELRLRMQVFLKHMPSKGNLEQTYKIANYQFDPTKLTLGDERYEHQLTQKEADVLYYLVNHIGTVLRREELLMEVWGKNDPFLGRSLDVFITRIRKYFRTQPEVEIQTVHGVGFKFLVSGAGAIHA